MLTGKQVLVTGASGFLGPRLCHRLRQENVQLCAVSRSFHKPSMEGLPWRQADLADIDGVRRLLTDIKPDIIFHLAGNADGGPDLQKVLATFHSNLTTTVNVLTTATELGCTRIVLAGSLNEPQRNESDVVPSSPYAASKWASSAYGRMFHALYKTPVVLARIFMTYGPGYQSCQKLVPYVILSALQGKAPSLASGSQQIDWIFIDDVVEGLLAVSQAADFEGRTIDIGSGRLLSIRALVKRIMALVDPDIEPLFGALDDRPMEQIRAADPEKSSATISWKPVIDLDDGLARTIEWYKERLAAGDLVSDRSPSSS